MIYCRIDNVATMIKMTISNLFSWKNNILIQTSQKFILKGAIDNDTTTDHVMAWNQTGTLSHYLNQCWLSSRMPYALHVKQSTSVYLSNFPVVVSQGDVNMTLQWHLLQPGCISRLSCFAAVISCQTKKAERSQGKGYGSGHESTAVLLQRSAQISIMFNYYVLNFEET